MHGDTQTSVQHRMFNDVILQMSHPAVTIITPIILTHRGHSGHCYHPQDTWTKNCCLVCGFKLVPNPHTTAHCCWTGNYWYHTRCWTVAVELGKKGIEAGQRGISHVSE